jgi:hypothetical protein
MSGSAIPRGNQTRVKIWPICALGFLTGCFGETFSLDGFDARSTQSEARAHAIVGNQGDPWSPAPDAGIDDGGGTAHEGGNTDPDLGTLLNRNPTVDADRRGDDAMLAADGYADRDSGDSSSIAVEPADASTSESGPLQVKRAGSAFVGDLSNIGTADFHISLTVTAPQMTDTSLVNQRTLCSYGVFWDIRVVKGSLLIETCDAISNYTAVTTHGPLVTDGKAHRVIVKRVAQWITAYIDGVASGVGQSKSSLGPLPPVSSKDPCEATGQFSPFLGSIADLGVTSP